VTKHLAWHLRGSGDVDRHARTLVDDGIVVIHDFLAPDEYRRVRAEYDRSRTEQKYLRDFDYARLLAPEVYESPDRLAIEDLVSEEALRIDPHGAVFPDTFELVRNNPTIRAIVAGAARRPVRDCVASFTVWRREDGPRGTSDSRRIKPRGEYMLHADTHYPTFKAWYYLSDVDEANGAFVYVKRSHRMTVDRLRYEYDAAVRVARSKADGSWLRLPYGHIRSVPAGYFERLGLHEEPITGPANTLVISNTCGFHRRGEFTSNRARETLHLDYRQLRYYANI